MSLSFLIPQLAFKVVENDKKLTFHIYVNFLKTFSQVRSSLNPDSGTYIEI